MRPSPLTLQMLDAGAWPPTHILDELMLIPMGREHGRPRPCPEWVLHAPPYASPSAPTWDEIEQLNRNMVQLLQWSEDHPNNADLADDAGRATLAFHRAYYRYIHG